LKNLSIQAQKAVTEIEILASKWNNTLDFEAVGIEIEKEIRRKFSDLENEFSNTSHELEEFQERMQRTNKFFYPTLYGAFIAIVGFIVLFLLEGIIGSLFGDSYYPMIATKVEQSTGFNTFMWYLAYLAPYAVITITILAILKLFIKKGRNYL
jgi:flagellar biosynthesis/type III secretory pathway M-ring protein FliF/YscJ